MRIIKYVELYNYLIKNCEMRPWEAIRSISRVRRMSYKLINALSEVMTNPDMIPNVEVGDVSLAELVNDEDMTPVEAILMLDWIERDPQTALTFMESERMRKPVEPLNEEDVEIVRRAIKNLELKGIKNNSEDTPEDIEQLDEDAKRDIVAHDDSTSKPSKDA